MSFGGTSSSTAGAKTNKKAPALVSFLEQAKEHCMAMVASPELQQNPRQLLLYGLVGRAAARLQQDSLRLAESDLKEVLEECAAESSAVKDHTHSVIVGQAKPFSKRASTGLHSSVDL